MKRSNQQGARSRPRLGGFTGEDGEMPVLFASRAAGAIANMRVGLEAPDLAERSAADLLGEVTLRLFDGRQVISPSA